MLVGSDDVEHNKSAYVHSTHPHVSRCVFMSLVEAMGMWSCFISKIVSISLVLLSIIVVVGGFVGGQSSTLNL